MTLGVEQEMKEYLSKRGIKDLPEERKAGLRALFEMSHLLTKDEQDALGKSMEEIERRKLTLYDDLRP